MDTLIIIMALACYAGLKTRDRQIFERFYLDEILILSFNPAEALT